MSAPIDQVIDVAGRCDADTGYLAAVCVPDLIAAGSPEGLADAAAHIERMARHVESARLQLLPALAAAGITPPDQRGALS